MEDGNNAILVEGVGVGTAACQEGVVSTGNGSGGTGGGALLDPAVEGAAVVAEGKAAGQGGKGRDEGPRGCAAAVWTRCRRCRRCRSRCRCRGGGREVVVGGKEETKEIVGGEGLCGVGVALNLGLGDAVGHGAVGHAASDLLGGGGIIIRGGRGSGQRQRR